MFHALDSLANTIGITKFGGKLNPITKNFSKAQTFKHSQNIRCSRGTKANSSGQ